MGPRLVSRGKGKEGLDVDQLWESLQWGRDLLVAESQALLPLDRRANLSFNGAATC